MDSIDVCILNSNYKARCMKVLDNAHYEEVYGIRKRRVVAHEISNELRELDHRYQCGIINIAKHRRANEQVYSEHWCEITLEPDKYNTFLEHQYKLNCLRSTIYN